MRQYTRKVVGSIPIRGNEVFNISIYTRLTLSFQVPSTSPAMCGIPLKKNAPIGSGGAFFL